jgi:hypothetical protein
MTDTDYKIFLERGNKSDLPIKKTESKCDALIYSKKHKSEVICGGNLINKGDLLVCENCGNAIQSLSYNPFIEPNEEQVYSNPNIKHEYETHRDRKSNFKKLLEILQGYEPKIPCQVIEEIRKEMKRKGITSNELTTRNLQQILRELRLTKYCENIHQIKSILS